MLNKNPSYLIKHRKKWQVKLTIPRDIRWAFNNKTTFKRSTGCNIDDLENAIIERDRIVCKFKSIVELHRSSSADQRKLKQLFGDEFSDRPLPDDYRQSDRPQDQQNLGINEEKSTKINFIKNVDSKLIQDTNNNTTGSNVEGCIKERLLKKSQKTRILRYDFWKDDKNEL